MFWHCVVISIVNDCTAPYNTERAFMWVFKLGIFFLWVVEIKICACYLLNCCLFRCEAERCLACTDYDSWQEADFKNYLKARYKLCSFSYPAFIGL